MRYVEARIDEFQRDEAYRIYVTRSLQLIPQNSYVRMSYTEMLNSFGKTETRSGDEIALDVIKNAGLSFGE